MAFRAGDGRVDQVALQHHVVAGIENHDDGGVFAALALVDCRCVGEGELFNFVPFVFHSLVVVKDGDLFCVLRHLEDDAHVPVEHVLVVVVLYLHHLVAVAPADPHNPVACLARVLQFLQETVEFEYAEGALAHRGEDLQVGFLVDVEFGSHSGRKQFAQNVLRLFGILERDEVEVRTLDGRGDDSGVDLCSLVGDVVSAGLPKDML